MLRLTDSSPILYILLLDLYFDNPVVLLLGGLVTILNWVTVWDTYEYFVYEYRQPEEKEDDLQ